MHREREKQRLQELSSTLHDLSFKMQEQAVQDAENDFLEEECKHLQRLLEEKNQELAAIQNESSASDSQSASPGVPSAASAIDSDTDMTDLQSSSVPLDPELGLKDHKAMHEAYQFVVSCDVHLCIASETRLLGTDLHHNSGGKTCTSTQNIEQRYMSALHSYFFVAKPGSWLEPPVLDTHTVNTPSSSKCGYLPAVWQEYRQWCDGIVLSLALYDAMSTYKVRYISSSYANNNITCGIVPNTGNCIRSPV